MIKNLKVSVLILIAFASLSMIIAKPVMAQDSVFNRLKQKFDSGYIFKANLTNQFIDSYTKDTMSTRGDIWIGKDRYKIILKDRYILVSNMISKVYNGIKNQVIISKYDPQEDDYAPSRFLSGSQKEYKITDRQVGKFGYLIEMRSNDPFSLFQKIEIEVTNNLVPIYIKAIDQTNNITLSRFGNGTFVKPTDKMFTISYPKDAEIIDLRK